MDSLEKENFIYDQGDSQNIPDLFPRFKRVRDSIISSLSDNSSSIQTFDWFGVDQGTHDHKGVIEEERDGVYLSLRVEGSTLDRQPELVIGANGKLVGRVDKKEYLSVDGNFVSADGREGAVTIVFENGRIVVEAYWLEDLKRTLVLEQVVDGNGRVFSREEMERMPNNKIYICQTHRDADTLLSLGIPYSQVFNVKRDEIGVLEDMQENRNFVIPGIEQPFPLRRIKKLTKKG